MTYHKSSLLELMGSLEYQKPFHPDELDTDLAALIQAEISEVSREF